MSKKKNSDQPKLHREEPGARKLKLPRIFKGVRPFDPEDPYDRIDAEKENQKLRAKWKREEFYAREAELQHQQKRDQVEAKRIIEHLGIRAMADYLTTTEVEIILRLAKSRPEEWPLRRRLLGERLAAREESGHEPLYPAWKDDELTEHRWLRECIQHHRKGGAIE